MRVRRYFSIILVALLAACATSPPNKIADIEAHKWRVTSFYDGSSMFRPADRYFTLRDPDLKEIWPQVLNYTFANGHITGFPSCGTMNGDYKLEGTHLLIHVDLLIVLAGFCYPFDWRMDDRLVDAFNGDRIIEHHGRDIVLKNLYGEPRVVLTPID